MTYGAAVRIATPGPLPAIGACTPRTSVRPRRGEPFVRARGARQLNRYTTGGVPTPLPTPKLEEDLSGGGW